MCPSLGPGGRPPRKHPDVPGNLVPVARDRTQRSHSVRGRRLNRGA